MQAKPWMARTAAVVVLSTSAPASLQGTDIKPFLAAKAASEKVDTAAQKEKTSVGVLFPDKTYQIVEGKMVEKTIGNTKFVIVGGRDGAFAINTGRGILMMTGRDGQGRKEALVSEVEISFGEKDSLIASFEKAAQEPKAKDMEIGSAGAAPLLRKREKWGDRLIAAAAKAEAGLPEALKAMNRKVFDLIGAASDKPPEKREEMREKFASAVTAFNMVLLLIPMLSLNIGTALLASILNTADGLVHGK